MHNALNKIKLILLPALVSILFLSNIQANNLSCSTDNIDIFIEAENINFIDISTLKSKKWSKNYFRAITDYKNNELSEKYKKKFSANIKVQFDNELECTFPSKIRISGDRIDHLGWGGGSSKVDPITTASTLLAISVTSSGLSSISKMITSIFG